MSDPQSLYNNYVQQYGIPKQPSNLMAYAKKFEIKLKFSEARQIITKNKIIKSSNEPTTTVSTTKSSNEPTTIKKSKKAASSATNEQLPPNVIKSDTPELSKTIDSSTKKPFNDSNTIKTSNKQSSSKKLSAVTPKKASVTSDKPLTTTSNKVTNFPIQFRIDNGNPTKVSYLKACTCKELIRVAKQKLSIDQLKQYTMTIIDDDGIQYMTDDDNLETAFEEIESDSDEELNQYINSDKTSRKVKNPLCLNVILQLKQQTTLNNTSIIHPDSKTYQSFKHAGQSTPDMRWLHKIVWVLKHQTISISAESIYSCLPGDKKKKPTVIKINELLSKYEKMNYIKSVSIDNVLKWQLCQASFSDTFWITKTKKTTKRGTKTKKTKKTTKRGVIFYQTQWIDKRQLEKMQQHYKNNMDTAPKILFNDNDIDNEREPGVKRKFNQAGIIGSYDRNSFGYGIVTTFYQQTLPTLADFKQLMDEQFKPLQQHLLNGNDIIIPALTETDTATYGRDKYYKNGKQVIFHSIGTGIGIAQLDFNYIMYIQEHINELCKFASKTDPIQTKCYTLHQTPKTNLKSSDDTKESQAFVEQKAYDSETAQIEKSVQKSEQQSNQLICPHGNLSMKKLEKIKMRKYNVCLIVGLSNDIATKPTLKSKQWFGQFGKIKLMSINKDYKYKDLKTALITYDTEISAMNAINFCNEYTFDNGRKLKARFGTQRYCPLFLSQKRCLDNNCYFRHSWCKSEDIWSQKDLNKFKAIKIMPDTIAPVKSDEQKVQVGPNEMMNNNDNNSVECPHNNLSIKELRNLKIRKRNVCFVVGLPIQLASEPKLRSEQWFGQFGNIETVAVNKNTKSIQANSISAHITYENDILSLNAINFCNKFIFDDGRKIKATFGTQHYCREFTANNKCTNPLCSFRHSWCELSDIITNKDIDDFKAIPSGAYTISTVLNDNNEKHAEQCPHGNLSLKELSNIKIRKRDTCFIIGLPNNIAIETILRQQKWFGQFGSIKKISVKGITCFITYDNDTSALNAINFCNNYTFDDGSGRKLKATFGSQSYCKWFLTKKSKCSNPICFQKHEWCRPEDVITQKDMHEFKAIPVNVNKAKKNNEHVERGWFVYQKKWLQKSQLEKMNSDYGARNLQKAPKILFSDNNVDNNRDTYTKRKYNNGTVKLIGEYDKSYGYGIVAEFYDKPQPKINAFKKLMDKQFKPLQQHLLNGYDVIVIQPTYSDIKRIGKNKFYENNKQVIYHKIGVETLPFSHIKYIQNKIEELSNYAEKVDTVEVYTYVPDTQKKKTAKRKKNKRKSSAVEPKPQKEHKDSNEADASEEIKSNEEQSNEIHFDNDVINQLVSLQVADEDEVKRASSMVIDYHNINVVKDKIEELRDQIDDHEFNMSGFVSELNQLTNVIQSRMKFMKEQEENVNALISASKSSGMLKDAKDTALETEKELLQQIINIQYINAFLNNIILIENLFNSVYTDDEKMNQQTARKKFAKDIEIYEKKPKPICNVGSFIELIVGAKMYISSFKKLLKMVDEQCKKTNIKIISNSGAKEKNIERAFYKAFYCYSAIYGNNGFKQMTDMLRCSLVFDSFDHLYNCFQVISEIAKLNDNGGILRCKDRFNPLTMPFGYRDLLINIKCPGSKIICEIQLHHKLFYKHKKISHSMYKKARLFEVNDKNLAYGYANQFTRKVIGDKVYEYVLDELDPYQLLTVWGLSCHAKVLIEVEGWADVHYWTKLKFENLKDMGFKTGQAHKFLDKVSTM